MEKKTVKKAAPAAAKKPVKKAAPAAKPAAKKAAPVAKPTVKKAAVKPATPVKKAEEKKPTVKKVAAKPAAPAKKVAAKPAAPAKKVAAKPVAPAKKVVAKPAAPAKKVAAKPAAPAKKVAAPAKKVAVKTVKKIVPAVEKNRYSPEELQEFKELILSKIAKAEKDLEFLQQAVAGSENDVSDTAPTFKTLEEGSNVLLKEENQKLAARQQKFIRDLRAALIRIENGTYGICQATGKLIPKERLMIVPHATMTVEAKEASKKRR
jgi:RNA polymerase-binding transcription factor DksA